MQAFEGLASLTGKEDRDAGDESEDAEGQDLALSFQDIAGCQCIWCVLILAVYVRWFMCVCLCQCL